MSFFIDDIHLVFCPLWQSSRIKFAPCV